MVEYISGFDMSFIIKVLLSVASGFLIGLERELKSKPAGISTHSLVIGGSMLFTVLSLSLDPNSPARVAAQIVSGIGFLGAGMILIGKGQRIRNLTTAASVWFAAAIG